MEFRLLGPLEVVEDGKQIDVGGAKQRALLAILLLHANEVVSQDRLIEALWEEEPPEKAQKALQVYVSQLRKVLGKERLETRAPGYRLRVGEDELDLDRFQRLADAEPREALALWRGEPLAKFAYQRFAQSEIARLEEVRLACLERRIEDDLAQGRHAALAGELERLVAEHPLRERLRAQLMLALYRSGRQAEALDAFQDARRALTEELGIEPSQELRQLQRAILGQDTGLALPGEPDRETPEEADSRQPAPPEVATKRREVRKTVTVLSSAISPTQRDLDPESLRKLTARAFEEVLPILERYDATVESSFGASLTAFFGVPVVHEDDALRAARAAVEMREKIGLLRAELETQWTTSIELRAGIGTGEVVTGGDGAMLATGEPVDNAIRLMHTAQAGQVLLDESTDRVVRESIRVEQVGEHVALLEIAPEARFRRHLDAPMVGRSREQRRLHDAFAQAIGDRSCQMFTIVCAPGVGKSRLVREFIADVAGEALVARGRCLPYGEGITYWPVLEAIRDAAGLDESEAPGEALSRIGAIVEGAEEAELVTARIGGVIGLSEHTSGIEETFAAIRGFFEALARRRALVLVFDDIHWGESTFLDLLVSEWTRDAPLLLVCIARPELLELRPFWAGGKLNATSVLLEPLSEAESLELVGHLADSDDLDETARQGIVDTAEGNPLFLEEMLAFLTEGADPHSPFELPPTIHALLAARLDQLPDAERGALGVASVEGKVFHESSVAVLSAARDVGAIRPHLLALVRKELIRPDRGVFADDRSYRFRHILIRDAAYDSIPKEERARLHELHADWLEQKSSDRILELEEILGYHLEQAHRYRRALAPMDSRTSSVGRRAAELLGTAGRRAFVRSDGPAGLNLISRAVALLPADDPLRVELVPNVRTVQGISDLSWADRVLTDAVEAAATTGNRELAAHALVQRGFLRLFTDAPASVDELLDVANRAIAVFEGSKDELGLARAWRLVAQAHYLGRSCSRCAEASERALAHAQTAADRFELREIVEWLVIALLLGPAHGSDAVVRCQRLLEETAGDPHLEAQILGALAPLLAMQGLDADADAAMERGAHVMEAAGESIWVVSFWRSMVHLWRNDPVAAEQELRPSYEALKRIGEQSHFSSLAHGLANALYMQNRYDETEELTRECEAACRPNDVHSHIFWRSIRAKVLARRGAYDDALKLAQEAVALAEDSDFLAAQAGALEDLAKVRYMAGKTEDELSALETAVERFEQKGNSVGAARTRALLDGAPRETWSVHSPR
jgi:DNA-binding SARP family transcriptional activator